MRRITPIIVVLLAIARAASGQGTDFVLPDPITSEDVSRYAAAMDISPQQRIAIDELHARYLDEFGALRDGEIESFLRESRAMMMQFMFNPDADEARKALATHDRLLDDVVRIDESFFNQLTTLLSSDQLGQLPRVRERRERERHRVGLTGLMTRANQGARADLAEMLVNVDYTDNLDVVDPMLREYENRLTPALDRLARETRKLSDEIVDYAEELLAARDGEQMFDPSQFRQFREFFDEASVDARRAADAVARLNWRSFRSMYDVAPPTVDDALVEQYVARTYGEVHSGMAETWILFRNALSRSDLIDDERDRIGELREVYCTQHIDVADDMVDIIDTARATGDWENMRRIGDELGPLRDRQKQIREQAELAMQPYEVAEAPAQQTGAFITTADGGGSGKADPGSWLAARRSAAPPPPNRFAKAGVDPFLPAAISRDELAYYADILGADANDAVVVTLFDDYRAAWDDLAESEFEQLRESARGLWSWDRENSRMTAPEDEAIDGVYALRDGAMDAVAALDLQLLEDVSLMSTADDTEARMDRAEAARDRVVWMRPPTGGREVTWAARALLESTVEESRIDLSVLVHELSGDFDTASTPALLDYEEAMNTAARRWYRAMSEAVRRAEYASAESVRNSSGGWGRGRPNSDDTARKAIRIARDRIIDLNREYLGAVADSLTPETAIRLERLYQRSAYPRVYREAGLDTVMQSALQLPDLTAAQRESLIDLLAEFQPAWNEACERLVAVERSRQSADIADGPTGWQRRQATKNQRERIEFDRDELESRTERRLRGILSDAQFQSLLSRIDSD